MGRASLSDREPRTGGGGPIEPGGARAFLLVVAGLLVAGALLPWGVLGLVLEIAAVFLGVRTLRRARASGRPAPGALAAVIGGTAATLLLVGLLGFVAVFYDEYSDYQRCFGRALTESAKDECRATFEDAIRARLGLGG